MKAGMSIDQNALGQLQKQLKELAKGLDEKEVRKGLMPGARLFAKTAKSKAPVGKHTHTYNNKKSGTKATFEPGNLKRSIGTLRKNKRFPNLVFVGPRIKRGSGAAGHFAGRRVNGYYAHFVEYGTSGVKSKDAIFKTRNKYRRGSVGSGQSNQSAHPFMRPGFEEAKGAAVKKNLEMTKKILLGKIRNNE